MSRSEDASSGGDGAGSRTVWFALQSTKIHLSRDCMAFRDTDSEDIIETTEEDAADAIHNKGRRSPGVLGPSKCSRCGWER